MIAPPLSAQTRVLTKFIFKILNAISDALSVCVLHKEFTKVIFDKLLVVTGCATHKPSDWCSLCLLCVFFGWLHVVYMVNFPVCFSVDARFFLVFLLCMLDVVFTACACRFFPPPRLRCLTSGKSQPPVRPRYSCAKTKRRIAVCKSQTRSA